MRAAQLLNHVIRPTLKQLALPGEDEAAAAVLLLGTAVHESGGLASLDQITRPGDLELGPAYGIYQIEPATLEDLQKSYLAFRPLLLTKFARFAAEWPDRTRQLVTNLAFATVVARLIYFRAPAPLPAAADLDGMARYWKAHFNTPAGKGTPEQWLADFRRHVSKT